MASIPLTYLEEILPTIAQILENVASRFYSEALSSVQPLLVFCSLVSVLQNSEHVQHIKFVFYEIPFCKGIALLPIFVKN